MIIVSCKLNYLVASQPANQTTKLQRQPKKLKNYTTTNKQEAETRRTSNTKIPPPRWLPTPDHIGDGSVKVVHSSRAPIQPCPQPPAQQWPSSGQRQPQATQRRGSRGTGSRRAIHTATNTRQPTMPVHRLVLLFNSTREEEEETNKTKQPTNQRRNTAQSSGCLRRPSQ